jgi:hypothetical protein
MASMAFVLLGCSDNSNSLVSTNERTNASGSLSKSAPMHSVTGSSLVRFTDAYGSVKIGTLTINAFLYQDGTADGTYNWVTFRGTGFTSDTKWGGQGKVKFLTMYPGSPYGNAAVICGLEGDKSSLPNQYLVWFLVDNGQGGSASGPDLCSEFVVSSSSDNASLTPEQIYALYPYFYTNEAGNIDIK